MIGKEVLSVRRARRAFPPFSIDGVAVNTFAQQRPEEPIEVRRERAKQRSDRTIVGICVLAAVGAVVSVVLFFFDMSRAPVEGQAENEPVKEAVKEVVAKMPAPKS
jgi:hypothetical protein